MQIIDLSHPLSENMPVFPGIDGPRIAPMRSFEQNGFREALLQYYTHTGTHIDAPAHALAEGAPLDELPIERFFGLALLVDVSEFAGREIPVEFFQPLAEEISFSQFVVLKSGWDKRWEQGDFYAGFPTLSLAAAEFLAGFSGLSGIGSDFCSVDPVESTDLPAHRALFGAGKILIENLCNLEQIKAERFLLSVLPVLHSCADGAPVRAAAFLAPAGIYYPR